MANNRMYLVHQSTGRHVALGKRMGWGWYSAPTEETLNELFDTSLEDLGPDDSQDDFILVQETTHDWVFEKQSDGTYLMRNIQLKTHRSTTL